MKLSSTFFKRWWGFRGETPKPYLFLPQMQEGKEKQSCIYANN